jgi:hypothetical protein
MEGSFADAANNHHFKRARWRRLWRQQIQDYLIAAIQNVRILLAHPRPKHSVAVAALASSAILKESLLDAAHRSLLLKMKFAPRIAWTNRCLNLTTFITTSTFQHPIRAIWATRP